MTTTREGICPNCGGRGPAGEPCGEVVCRRRGYHFLPSEYVRPDGEAFPDPLVGLRLGDYLIADLVGAGGMGRVYLGLQQPLWMPAAVKLLALDILPPSIHENLRRQFEAEARALSLLQHPNVVRLLHFGEVFRQPYLVMEFVAGGRTLLDDVRDRADGGRRYSAAEIGHLLRQVLDGLGAAHAVGIVHRDVKPENLMLQSVVGHPLLLRILDFGLAKFLHAGHVTGTASGTPDYMAPEQIRTGTLGPWTDLYAAGVVAYELLTGIPAFGVGTAAEVMGRKLDPEWDPLARLPHPLPDEVRRFLGTALEPDPQRRYRNHEAMRLGLDRALEALGAAPADPLRDVSLRGLVVAADIPTAPADRGAARPARRSAEPSARSDEALRRWLDREEERLAEAARRLRRPE